MKKFTAVVLMATTATAFLLNSAVATAKTPIHKCTNADWQSCTKCTDIEKAIDWKRPGAGDYYRGAYWNDLYATYRGNCQALGKKLIAAGANPNLGGTYGSMILSISSSWPHNKIAINRQWVDILKGADVDAKLVDIDGKSARQKAETPDMPFTIDYPEIWKHYLNKKP